MMLWLRVATLLMLSLICGMSVNAQTPLIDSSFSMSVFDANDIVKRPPRAREKVSGANRIPEEADDLPVQTYVITSDEIMTNGYTTLVDILKTIPGFRVSQPGSGLYGETFTMRGLLGNEYTRIMINGVPIAPSAAPGMPLGANLPIKQAERVEIILGPAATIYGADAIAGVINIILPEVDSPIEAMASLGVGTLGASEMHLRLGGVLGMEKTTRRNMLEYSFYASTKRNDVLSIHNNDEIFEVDTLTAQSPLYFGEGITPRIGDFTHDSRIFGIDLHWRDWSLSFQQLYRFDHSSLGSHPSEAAWHDPNLYVAEFINIGTLRREKFLENDQWWISSSLSAVGYDLDPNSSYYGVDHPLSNGVNYLYAESRDVYAEQLVAYSKNDFNLMLGASGRYMTGVAFQNYLALPFDWEQVDFDEDTGEDIIRTSWDDWSVIDSSEILSQYNEYIFGAFAQGYYRKDNWSLVGGLRFDKHSVGDFELSPKLGAFYKVNKKLRLRAFVGRGFRIAPTAIRFNNFRDFGTPDDPLLKIDTVTLNPEILWSYEAGGTYDVSDMLRFGLHFYLHQTSNSIFPLITTPNEFAGTPDTMQGPPPPPMGGGMRNNYRVGFGNLRDNFSQLATLQFSNWITTEKFSSELSFQVSRGVESLDTVAEIESYRNVPEFQVQANLHYRFGNGVTASIYSGFYSGFTSSLTERNDDLTITETSGYYNIDLLITKSFTETFFGYFRVNNLSNTFNKGIQSNYFSGFEFEYIPQLSRMFYIGLTYQLN